ncbi:DUF3375 family protein [Nocardioides sp. W3-2-3]|nr:DUF3375 family protein [Nocardioides convexus]
MLSLVSALPSDFARVEERFATIRSEILAAFRAEDRPAGEVIDDYLARADALMTATHEGRAFEGAFALLRDDALVTRLREDLGALLDHPLSDGILADAERAEPAWHGAPGPRRPGPGAGPAQPGDGDVEGVHRLPRRRPRPRAWSRPCARSSPSLMTWMAGTGPRATHDVSLLPRRIGVDHLRERFHDPADDVLPDRISAADPAEAPQVSLAEPDGPGRPAGSAACASGSRTRSPTCCPRAPSASSSRAWSPPCAGRWRSSVCCTWPPTGRGRPSRRRSPTPPYARTGRGASSPSHAPRCPTPTWRRPAHERRRPRPDGRRDLGLAVRGRRGRTGVRPAPRARHPAQAALHQRPHAPA